MIVERYQKKRRQRKSYELSSRQLENVVINEMGLIQVVADQEVKSSQRKGGQRWKITKTNYVSVRACQEELYLITNLRCLLNVDN